MYIVSVEISLSFKMIINIQMTDLYMVVMLLCHFPTLHHNYIFPPGGNMSGGNMLLGHYDLDDDVEEIVIDI